MDSLDLEVLQTCATWLQQGVRCELVTVLKTWGSSPRPPGALLALCQDGRVAGSVSGGCIEDDLIASVQQHGMQRRLPQRVVYGVTADEAHRFGLPCGGTIELLIEPWAAETHLPLLQHMLAQLGQQQLLARRVDFHTGAMSLRVLAGQGRAVGETALGGDAKTAPAESGFAQSALAATGSEPPSLSLDEDSMTALHGPRWRLLIIGAGPLSRFLAQMAQALDYLVIVCDPREEYRNSWQLPGVAVVHAMPDDWILAQQPDAHTAVVALTHDPKLDDLALMEALKSPAFYVGALGSRANNAKRRERLLQFDLNPQQVARLHGPIGLYIGSKTPSEIAVSILAEMTAVKNGVAWPRQSAQSSDSSQCTMATTAL